jgi:hypothetical protein
MRNAKRMADALLALTLTMVGATMATPAEAALSDIIFINGFDTLTVSVIDENGSSAGAGVAVLLQDSDGALLQTLATDSSGTALVHGVPGAQ